MGEIFQKDHVDLTISQQIDRLQTLKYYRQTREMLKGEEIRFRSWSDLKEKVDTLESNSDSVQKLKEMVFFSKKTYCLYRSEFNPEQIAQKICLPPNNYGVHIAQRKFKINEVLDESYLKDDVPVFIRANAENIKISASHEFDIYDIVYPFEHDGDFYIAMLIDNRIGRSMETINSIKNSIFSHLPVYSGSGLRSYEQIDFFPLISTIYNDSQGVAEVAKVGFSCQTGAVRRSSLLQGDIRYEPFHVAGKGAVGDLNLFSIKIYLQDASIHIELPGNTKHLSGTLPLYIANVDGILNLEGLQRVNQFFLNQLEINEQS